MQSHANLEVNNTFDLICLSAKQKNREVLRELTSKGVCLDLLHKDRSPVMLLAMEGDLDAAHFLMNEFGANRNYGAAGYALGGHMAAVDELLAQGASLDYAVRGYAEGGYITKVGELLAQGASPEYAVAGYARGGYIAKANKLLAQGADLGCAIQNYAANGDIKEVEKLLLQGASLDYAALGYARGGLVDEVEKLLLRGASLDFAVLGYATSGLVVEVEKLRARGASLNHIAQGYARGGHITLADEILAQGASIDFVIGGYACGRHTTMANKLLAQGAGLDFAVWGYASDHNIPEVNKLIAQGASIDFAITGYVEGWHAGKKNILRLASLTHDEKTRTLLLQEANKKDHSIDVNATKIKAMSTNRTMREYQLDYDQARSLSTMGARAWLLQGPQLVKNNQFGLIEDIFFKISAMVLGLPLRSTEAVYRAVHNRLFFGIEATLKTTFTSWLNGKDVTKELVDKADERCTGRKSFAKYLTLFAHRDLETRLPEINPVCDDNIFAL